MDDVEYEAMYAFIVAIIDKNFIGIKENKYDALAKIIGKENLESLAHYLTINKEASFSKLLKKLLAKQKVKKELLNLKTSLPRLSSLWFSKKDIDGKTCTLFYGTNREPKNLKNIAEGYGNKRANKLYMGACQVYVPKSHKIGETNSSLWKKLIHLDSSYGKLKLKTLTGLEKDDFWKEISTLLGNVKEEEKEALLFIHGFNTSFEDAAIRATQISVDLNFKGITAFFSWPSKARAISYLSDESTIQYSKKYLSDFLSDFAEKSGAKRVNIIAHSMGNRALLDAVNRISRNKPEVKFGQIILAAPDVDVDVFEELSEAYQLLCEQTTLYVSNKDKAVGMSKWLHAEKRVGFTPPVCVVPNISTIKVSTKVGLLELGHGYFSGNKVLLEDMHQLLNFKLSPNKRKNLLVEEIGQVNQYWRLKA